MRIGLFTDQWYPQVSGVVTSIKMLYEGLEAMGHECFIFTSFDDDKNDNSPELRNKKIVNLSGMHYPFKVVKDYKFTFNHKKTTKIIKKYNLDIIHLHTEFSIAGIAEHAAKKLNIPLVHTFHTAWINYIVTLFPKTDSFMHNYYVHLLKKMFTGPIGKISEIEILPTKKVLSYMKDYGMYDKEYRVIPTGIELDRFERSNFKEEELQKLKESLGLKDKFVFAYIGRLAKEKNIEYIVEGFAKTFKNVDDARLMIVGDGPILDSLKKEVSKFEIEDKVVFTGMISWDKVPMYYHISDVFLNASKSETQGLTYIEALTSKLPTVVYKDDCVIDLIVDGYNGYYFENMDELEEKIKLIYDRRNELSTMKENAYKSAIPYSKKQFAESIYNTYCEAINMYKERNNKK